MMMMSMILMMMTMILMMMTMILMMMTMILMMMMSMILAMMMTMILMMISREGGWRVAGATLAAAISRLPAPWTSALRSPPPFSILHFEEDFVKSTT